MADTANNSPESVRRLETDTARRLARTVSVYEELQTALRCCEALLPMLADPRRSADDVQVEALWTRALLGYARGFLGEDAPLGTDDLPEVPGDDAPASHQIFLHLRDHVAAEANPREVYTVGVVQDTQGAVTGLAVTSVPTPQVDEGAVRRLGALAYRLCELLDGRVESMQRSILEELQGVPRSELEALEVIPVSAPG